MSRKRESTFLGSGRRIECNRHYFPRIVEKKNFHELDVAQDAELSLTTICSLEWAR